VKIPVGIALAWVRWVRVSRYEAQDAGELVAYTRVDLSFPQDATHARTGECEYSCERLYHDARSRDTVYISWYDEAFAEWSQKGVLVI
jgi:hypothetical protein